jgi:hypothetical protein
MMLERGGWYGWTMWPGYLDTPYHSPIRVEALDACKTGNGRFDLTFINAAYARGVADMTYQLRMLQRGPSYLLASVADNERAVCIERLDLAWLEKHMPDADLPFDTFRQCSDELMAGRISLWLDINYGS